MKKWLLRILYAGVVLLPAAAVADYTATQGAGTTVFSFVCSTTKICPAMVLIDSSNVEKGTSSNPVRTDPTGTTTQPVSVAGVATSALQTTGNTSLATIATNSGTQATAANQTTGNTSLATIATNTGAGATAANQTKPNTAATTNPTSTLTLPSTTTAYLPMQLVANSATAGSVVVPSFAIANSAGAAQIARVCLVSNDSTSTGWAGQSLQVDLWTTAPTFTNGDRGTYAVATGSANYLGSFSGTFAPIAGDGTYGCLAPTVGNAVQAKLASGTSIFWTLQALTGSGVTGASKTMTLRAEVVN